MSWPRPEQVDPDRYADRFFSLTSSSDRTDLIPDPPDPDLGYRPWAASLMEGYSAGVLVHFQEAIL